MEKQICNIICIENGQKRTVLIELAENEDYVSIKILLGGLVLIKEGDNYFETLIKLRRELEKMDIKLLCKGCCKNVYPSGMLLDMGTGRKAYTLSYGEQAKLNSMVDIFDDCSLEEYATIEEQSEYFESWILSIRR